MFNCDRKIEGRDPCGICKAARVLKQHQAIAFLGLVECDRAMTAEYDRANLSRETMAYNFLIRYLCGHGSSVTQMLEHQITLPETTYNALLTLAQQQGMTPADWIASQLSSTVPQEQPLSALIADLIGAINSQTEPHPSSQTTPFGEAIATKLARQGIRRP